MRRLLAVPMPEPEVSGTVPDRAAIVIEDGTSSAIRDGA